MTACIQNVELVIILLAMTCGILCVAAGILKNHESCRLEKKSEDDEDEDEDDL